MLIHRRRPARRRCEVRGETRDIHRRCVLSPGSCARDTNRQSHEVGNRDLSRTGSLPPRGLQTRRPERTAGRGENDPVRLPRPQPGARRQRLRHRRRRPRSLGPPARPARSLRPRLRPHPERLLYPADPATLGLSPAQRAAGDGVGRTAWKSCDFRSRPGSNILAEGRGAPAGGIGAACGCLHFVATGMRCARGSLEPEPPCSRPETASNSQHPRTSGPSSLTTTMPAPAAAPTRPGRRPVSLTPSAAPSRIRRNPSKAPPHGPEPLHPRQYPHRQRAFPVAFLRPLPAADVPRLAGQLPCQLRRTRHDHHADVRAPPPCCKPRSASWWTATARGRSSSAAPC